MDLVAESPKESELKVVDRRWWARGNSDDANEETTERTPTVVDDLERHVAQLQEQLVAVRGEYRRAADEFDQARARIRRDIGREVERGRRAVLAEMLEVLDNLDRAIAAARRSSATDTSETLLRGVELVQEQFLARLHALGVARLVAVGTPFDPQQHEAVSMVPVDDPAQAGLVVAVSKEGYVIGEELLRAASVAVGAHG